MGTAGFEVPVLGILGGIASGKSYVARLLAERGAAILDGDRAGHAVLELPEVVQAARERWGEDVLDRNGRIDRSRLAKHVFAPTPDGAAELKHLERLTHPRIKELLQRQGLELARTGAKALVLDAAVMRKAGWDEICDKIVFVDAPRRVRLARAKERGWSEEEFAAREGAQESLDEKRQLADWIIDNSGTPEETEDQVARLWRSLAG